MFLIDDYSNFNLMIIFFGLCSLNNEVEFFLKKLVTSFLDF